MQGARHLVAGADTRFDRADLAQRDSDATTGQVVMGSRPWWTEEQVYKRMHTMLELDKAPSWLLRLHQAVFRPKL